MHALHESWRVLVPGGQLLDLRPLSINPPFEVIYPTEIKVPGLVDMSLDRENEVAANRALDEVVQAGTFKIKERDLFDFAYYWDSVDGAIAYVRDEWEDSAQIPEKLVKRACSLPASPQMQNRVRIQLRLQLTSLEKA